VLGLGIGYSMKLFNYFDARKTKWPKLIVVLIMAVAVPVISEVTKFYEAKFVCIIFFGFMCYRYWGEDKPEHELSLVWMICEPFLFGSVGAAVLFSQIEPSMLGQSVGVIVIGVTFRWLGTFAAGMERKFTNKERVFMAFSWIPKATVQAALGGVTLATATKEGIPEYVEFGQGMLTTAVFAICITAPLGAIFITTLGPKLLDLEEPDTKDGPANESELPAVGSSQVLPQDEELTHKMEPSPLQTD